MCTQNSGQDFVQDFGRNFMAHAATGEGQYYGADVALLEVGRRLELLCPRGGGDSFSLSMCVCVIEKGGGEFECILQLLAS
jgi:hypothetical protein